MTREEPKSAPFYKLFTFADGYDMVLMSIGTVSAVANGLSTPAQTILIGIIINTFATTDTAHVAHEVSKVALNYLYLALAAGAAAFLQVSTWMVTGERQAARIRALYLKTVLRQDITFFDMETTSGEVVGRMSGDTAVIQNAIGEKVGKFIQLSSTFLGGFVVGLVKGWQLSLVMLSCLPLLVMAIFLLTKLMIKTSVDAQMAYAGAGNIVEQTTGAIRTVASFTGEDLAKERYNRLLKKTYSSFIKLALASGIGTGFVLFVFQSSFGIAIWYGAKLIIENGYSGGQVINVIVAVLTGGTALGQASPCLSVFAAGQAAAHKMFEAIKREPLVDTYDKKGIVLEDIKGDIELKDIHFSYPARPDVQIFSGFSFHVMSGTVAALVGESGSGKSTVISLLERFYDPQSGEVLIDGITMQDFQLKWIRDKIGLVSQEPILFTTSIKENIAYGKESATKEEIRRAVELANAARFIDQLPNGIDTMVGERGSQLSGGQKQRIAIARAILKDPKILLLDEATSALDAESERVVQAALARVLSNRTTVIVAHRLSTIRNADTIAVVKEGKIVEQGTHTELIENSHGAYSRLIQLQEENVSSLNSYSDEPIVVVDTRTWNKKSPAGRIPLPSPSGYQKLETETTEKAPTKASVARLVAMNKPESLHLLLGSLAAAVHGVIQPVFAILMAMSIKIFYEPPHQLRKDSKFWSLAYVGLGSIGMFVIPVQHYFLGVAGGKLIQRIRSKCFEKIVHQEISWFDEPTNSSEAIGARLSSNASSLKSLAGDYVALIVENFSTITAAVVIAFVSNWLLALVVLTLLPLLGLEAYAAQKFLQGLSEDAKVKYEEASQIASDAIGNIRTVASFCAEQKVIDLYQGKCEGPKKYGVRRGVMSGLGSGFANFTSFATYAVIFYIGAKLVKVEKATFKEVFTVILALSISAITISETSAMAHGSNEAKDATTSIFNILDRETKIDSSNDEGTTLSSVKGDIDFIHVSFHYSTRPDVPIFKDLCLSISSGQTVALVGESGSGKSTTICLMERFYDPVSGHIMLDGVKLRRFNLKWLRQQMGLVSQEPILLNETIQANITYGRQGTASEEEVAAAAKAANAHNFISGLPQGYLTSVGTGGVQLSGGQKQRIAIARAILRDPKILLLDEATSAVDTESECIVQEALERVMVNRTTVVVAHRLSTITGADEIAVLKNGSIVENGSHEQLMKIANGAYASLVSLHASGSN